MCMYMCILCVIRNPQVQYLQNLHKLARPARSLEMMVSRGRYPNVALLSGPCTVLIYPGIHIYTYTCFYLCIYIYIHTCYTYSHVASKSSFYFSEKFLLCCLHSIIHTSYDTVQKANGSIPVHAISICKLLDNMSGYMK